MQALEFPVVLDHVRDLKRCCEMWRSDRDYAARAYLFGDSVNRGLSVAGDVDREYAGVHNTDVRGAIYLQESVHHAPFLSISHRGRTDEMVAPLYEKERQDICQFVAQRK